MPDNPPLICIRLPLPASAYLAMALPALVSVGWLLQGRPVWAAAALIITLLLLPIGQKFELDTVRQRYCEGYHWAHWLNPAWQQLPLVQGVLVRPYAYRPLHRSRYSDSISTGPLWEGYTVLLSVPHSRRGVVVASVKDEAEAETIAAEVAGALQVPWQQV